MIYNQIVTWTAFAILAMFICYMVSLFILEIASFQIHEVLLDPGHIIKHTPLASRSTISPTYSFHFGVEMI